MRFLARLLVCLAALAFAAQPVAAQEILRDAETEALLQDMVNPLVKAAGLPSGNVEVVMINDPTMNAFVAGGQRIYIHSGLINAADNANQVQGVLAHELGHITGGHAIRYSQGAAGATRISLLSMLLGIGAALAGAGAAGMGLMALGQQAAMGKFLAYTRTEESSADAASVQFLSKAGITGKGSIGFFKKLQNYYYRYGYDQSDEASFAQSHPMPGDRVDRLEADFKADPAWDKPPDPDLEKRFQRIKAKLYGYLAKPEDTLRAYPEYMTGAPARYARAYAYHKEALMDKAVAETDALLADEPENPYFLELKGQVLLESGKPKDAIDPLRRATALSNNQPLIASTFGHALIATEDPQYYDEAKQVLRSAVARDRENPVAWYQLGLIYAAPGAMPRARLASAEQQVMTGRMGEALRSAEIAESALPTGTPDWLRAQDIALQARAELERERKRK
jgi:predicted Zn-dependent protease